MDGEKTNKQTNQGTLKGLNNKGAAQWEKKAHWTNTIQKSSRNDPKKKNQEAAEENKQHEGEQQVNYDTNESGEKNNGGK